MSEIAEPPASPAAPELDLDRDPGRTRPSRPCLARPRWPSRRRRCRAAGSRCWSLANVGLWLGVYAPIQVLLPEQAQHLDRASKTLLLSAVMGAGALAALVTNPIAGALSGPDHVPLGGGTRGRGRRRAGRGRAGRAGRAPDAAVMMLGWFLAQAGLGVMLATLTAALPDRVPVAQRGALGGLIGISQMLGTVIGALLVTVLVTGLASGYLACGVLVVLAALTFALFTPDDVLPAALVPKQTVRATLGRAWVSPRRYPDFGWAWFTCTS